MNMRQKRRNKQMWRDIRTLAAIIAIASPIVFAITMQIAQHTGHL